MSRFRPNLRAGSIGSTATAAGGNSGPTIINRPIGRRRRVENEELVQLDWTKSPRENLIEILRHIVLGDLSIVTKAQKLAYLNCFSKFCIKLGGKISDSSLTGFTLDEIFLCLRAALFHESAEVRASSLRAIRYGLAAGRKPAARSFERLNLHLLVARSLDIVLENRLERVQAVRLIRQYLTVCGSIPPLLIRPMVAIARDGMGEKDYLTRSTWAILSELVLLDPESAIEIGVVAGLYDCILSAINTPIGIVESMIGSVATLLNWPATRARLMARGMDLSYFLAPFTDSHFSLPVASMFRGGPAGQHPTGQSAMDMVESPEMREMRLHSNKNALICLLRSWQGMILLCGETSSTKSTTSLTTPQPAAGLRNGIKSLVEMLYLPHLDVQKFILELIFELFYIPLPDWNGMGRYSGADDFNQCDNGWHLVMIPGSGQGQVREDWQLYNEFVAAEGRSLIPHSAGDRVDLIGNYLALLLRAFFEAGLVDALTHLMLIADSDRPAHHQGNRKPFSSDRIRATLLLGELLHLSTRYLPVDLVHQYHPLPRLIAFACSCEATETTKRDFAKSGISHLNQLHNVRLDPLANCSLYLEQQVRFKQKQISKSTDKSKLAGYCGHTSNSDSLISSKTSIDGFASLQRPKTRTRNSSFRLTKSKLRDRARRFTLRLTGFGEGGNSLTGSSGSGRQSTSTTSDTGGGGGGTCLRFDVDEMYVERSLRDTQVITVGRDYDQWDWPLILTILTWPVDECRKVPLHEQFIRRLIQFYKPTSKQFSHIDQSHPRGKVMCHTGLVMIDFLMFSEDARYMKFLEELISDIGLALSQITIDNAPLNAILSPARVLSSLSQTYFLLVGHISSDMERGNKLLEKLAVWHKLTELVGLSHHDVYIKLIISSLDYSYEQSYARKLLKKVLTGSNVTCRLYATQFLRILFRLNVGGNFSKWGLTLLLDQFYDKQVSVSLCAREILDEVCDRDDCLEELIRQDPPLIHRGSPAEFIVIRYLSLAKGFQTLHQSRYLERLIDEWHTTNAGGMCVKYVRLVEDQLNESLSMHHRSEEGIYGRRTERRQQGQTFLLPHLYGELAKTPDGYEVILKYELISDFYRVIRRRDSNYSSYKSVIQLKAALWAVCHVGSTPLGLNLVAEADVIPMIVDIVRSAPVLSVRGVAFYGLCLISSTLDGAALLTSLGWESTRYNALENAEYALRTGNEMETAAGDKSSQENQMSDEMKVIDEDLYQHHRDQRISMSSMETPTVDHELHHSTSSKVATPANDSILSTSFEVVQPGLSSSGTTNGTEDVTRQPHGSEDHQHHIRKQDIRPDSGLADDSGGGLSSSHLNGVGGYSVKSTGSEMSTHSSETITRLAVSPTSQKGLVGIVGHTVGSSLYHSPEIHMRPDGTATAASDRGRKVSTSSRGQGSGLKGSKSFMYSRQTSACSVASSGHSHGHGHGSSGHHGHVTACDARGYAELRNIQEPRTRSIKHRLQSKSLCMDDDKLVMELPQLSSDHQTTVIGSNIHRGSAGTGDTKTLPNRKGSGSKSGVRERLISTGSSLDEGMSASLDLSHSHHTEGGNSNSHPLIGRMNSIEEDPTVKQLLDASHTNSLMSLAMPVDLSLIFGSILPTDSPMSRNHHGHGGIPLAVQEETDTDLENELRLTPDDQRAKHARQRSADQGETTQWRTHLDKDARQSFLINDGLELHSDTNCIACFKVTPKMNVGNQSDRHDKKTDETEEETGDQGHGKTLESLDEVPHGGNTAPVHGNNTHRASYHSMSDQILTEGNQPFHSNPTIHRALVRKEVLRYVSSLSGSVAAKPAEQALLNLKRKYGDSFKDVCLYSEIALQLGGSNFRLPARRFLQELFLDVSFEPLTHEAELMVSHKASNPV